MPYALILTGIVIFLATFRGDISQLGTLLKGDILSGNFLYWIGAVIVLGAIGYIKALKHFSDLFLVLLIVALMLSNRGFFAQFMAALKQIKAGNCPKTKSASSANTHGAALSGGNSTLAQGAQSLTSWANFLTPQSASANPVATPSIMSLTVTPGGAL